MAFHEDFERILCRILRQNFSARTYPIQAAPRHYHKSHFIPQWHFPPSNAKYCRHFLLNMPAIILLNTSKIAVTQKENRKKGTEKKGKSFPARNPPHSSGRAAIDCTRPDSKINQISRPRDWLLSASWRPSASHP